MSNVTLGKVAILKRETFYVDGVEVTWISGYEDEYAISKDGQVYQAPKVIWRRTRWSEEKYQNNIPGRWISKFSNKDGYDIVFLHGKEKKLHRLLALNWIYNPDPKHRTEVDHENRTKTDNRLCNLRWLTHWENRLNQQNPSGLEAGQGKDPDTVKAANKRANDKRKNDREYKDEQNAKRRAKRAAETPEEKEERRARQREYQRQNRARKKAEAQAQAEAGE